MKTRKMTLSGILLCASICFISCGKITKHFPPEVIWTHRGMATAIHKYKKQHTLFPVQKELDVTTGGRGGKICYVTSLNDELSDNTTLRYALSRNEPRIIIFKVSGTIKLKKNYLSKTET
ncbi:MAG: hypothetical protein ACLTTW_01920 [Coprobacter sp.]